MEKKIIKAMLSIMGQVGEIPKDQTNAFQKFNYRGIDSFYNKLNGLLSKEGVLVTAEILVSENQSFERVNAAGKANISFFTSLTIRYHFTAIDGSSVFTDVRADGLDNGDKAATKAMSMCQKYAYIQVFNIPTDDLDPDASSPTVVKPKTVSITDEKLIEGLQAEKFGSIANGGFLIKGKSGDPIKIMLTEKQLDMVKDFTE